MNITFKGKIAAYNKTSREAMYRFCAEHGIAEVGELIGGLQ